MRHFLSGSRTEFDERDAALLAERQAEWDKRTGPRVGDFVRMLDGTLRRFAYDWGVSLQTTCKGYDASFYFFGSGMSFSGSLAPSIPRASIEDTGETMEGAAWFFHHNQPGAGRGVRFLVKCRVWRQLP